METTRRNFIRNIGIHSAAFSLFPTLPLAESEMDGIRVPTIPQDVDDEDFWAQVQQSYTTSPALINLNNGGVSPQPKFVQEAFQLYTSMSNKAPSYFMWRELEPTRINIRKDLSELLGCSHEEVVINRNATESLDTVIFGLDLKKGDEVVLSPYDYPNMRNAWEQRKKRDGIVLKYVDITLPDDNEDAIVEAFKAEMTGKTSLVHITHMVNYNGQVLPAKRIAEAAKANGSLVMLDGAHTFAHIPFSLKEIPCDFFGTSLHKWLCAPFGTGMMYIKKERIPEVWPFCPTDAVGDEEIEKFEAMGTRSVPAEVAAGQAILFHRNIGIERKYNRLKQLTDHWSVPFKNNPRFVSYTPSTSVYGSLYTFGIEGMESNDIANHLQRNQKIITSPIMWRNINGCRVSPHVYTSKSDLDRLSEGIEEMLKG